MCENCKELINIMNGDDINGGGLEEEEEEDGMSDRSLSEPPPSLTEEERLKESQLELEIRFFEALEFYPVVKLVGVHRHFVLNGLTEYLNRRLNRQFSTSEVLQLVESFYNLEMLKPDDEETEILNQEEEFSLPSSYFLKDES